MIEDAYFNQILPEYFKKNYKIISIIGRGAYGVILKVLKRKNNKNYACKVFFNIYKDHIDAKRILREVYILQRIKHKNIIKVVDLYCDFENIGEENQS